MKKGLTEMVFILDRSGSMRGLEGDTVGGYNAMLEKQKNQEGEAIVSTVLFDDRFEVLHNRVSIKDAKPLSTQEYYVRGSTALLDAIGRAIRKIGYIQKNTPEADRDEKVVFVITTDGMENASHEFCYDDIKKMIEHQKEAYGWEFIFLGANIDAATVAERVGIRADRSANFHHDHRGTQMSYQSINDAISDLRQKATISAQWKAEIDLDFTSRKPDDK